MGGQCHDRGAGPGLKQGVARDVQPVHAVEQLEREIGFTQMGVGTAIGEKAALSIGIDKADQRAGGIGHIAAQMGGDALPFEMAT